MADSPILPGSHRWKLVPGPGGGAPDLPPEFFKFFRDLVAYVAQTQGNTDSLADILARLDALEATGANSVTGQFSVQTFQQDAATLVRLVGDIPAPAALSYYGSDAEGNRGWYQRLLSTLADIDFTTPPVDGQALIYDAVSETWKPGDVNLPQVFSYITMDGEPYGTADASDLYTGVL